MAVAFTPIDPQTAAPADNSSLSSAIARSVGARILAAGGWRMQGDWPGLDKCVLLAAPHTSNWDGLNMLAAAAHYRIKLRWMRKKSLTTGPFGFVIKWLGCVPVDRSVTQDLVRQMKQAFAAEARLVLAIAPEGTRARNPTWKRGYYHIAHGAGVPIVLSVLDYGARTITLAGVLRPTGDYDADVALIRGYYERAVPKYPARYAVG
jgi:1-acyl-sn-glycerol-3-phosphate acyltransferase